MAVAPLASSSLVPALLVGAACLACGWGLHALVVRLVARESRTRGEALLRQAETERDHQTDRRLRALRADLERSGRRRERGLKRRRDSLTRRAEKMTGREDVLADLAEELREKDEALGELRKAADKARENSRALGRTLRETAEGVRKSLIERSGCDEQQVKDSQRKTLEKTLEAESEIYCSRKVESFEADLEKTAREAIWNSIGRLQLSHYNDPIATTVDLSRRRDRDAVLGDKARRLEELLDVKLTYDEETQVLVIGDADGVTRETARRVVDDIIAGRDAKKDLEELCGSRRRGLDQELIKVGRWAVKETGLPELHRDLLPLLGRLKYRSSYGQNVLYHSIEVARLTRFLSREIGLAGETLALKCGLLHDIGKALDHEREGGHPEIGAQVLEAAGEAPEVVEAARGHHMDPKTQSTRTNIVGAADAISAARPGARRETFDKYIQRLQSLESIATSQRGVEGAYAIHAGREVRVMVDPEIISDEEAVETCAAIARQIEKELNFPGQVKVVLMREKKVVEHAR